MFPHKWILIGLDLQHTGLFIVVEYPIQRLEISWLLWLFIGVLLLLEIQVVYWVVLLQVLQIPLFHYWLRLLIVSGLSVGWSDNKGFRALWVASAVLWVISHAQLLVVRKFICWLLLDSWLVLLTAEYGFGKLEYTHWLTLWHLWLPAFEQLLTLELFEGILSFLLQRVKLTQIILGLSQLCLVLLLFCLDIILANASISLRLVDLLSNFLMIHNLLVLSVLFSNHNFLILNNIVAELLLLSIPCTNLGI